MKRVCCVVGARPNFVKMAPVIWELERRGLPYLLVHTGQHYDYALAGAFFEELELPRPHVFLGAGSGTHSRQTARVMVRFEQVCRVEQPSLVFVPGDVNSTVAAALVAAKEGIPLAHLEAGLRSFDRSMPEEINRIVTDHLSDLLFTTEESANRNLMREGVPQEAIRFVGNCMVDTLLRYCDRARARQPWRGFGLDARRYAVITLHRPGNVDVPQRLLCLVEGIRRVANRIPVVFPVHPRTAVRLKELGVVLDGAIHACEPMPYLEFIGLLAGAGVVLTDSGGVQEETTTLGVPCLTLRANTERPVTLEAGTNRLVGFDPGEIEIQALRALEEQPTCGKLPPLWDGRAAVRVLDAVEQWLAAGCPRRNINPRVASDGRGS